MKGCGNSEVLYLDTAGMSEEFFGKISGGLSKERTAKAERCRFQKDRRLSLGAGYLLDIALKERGLSEREAAYTYGEHGKPYLKDCGLYFNLSHSGTVAVAAVSDREIGVDVQKFVPVSEALVKKVCTDAEASYLFTLSEGERGREFARLWAVRESVLKFWGTGLTVPLKKLKGVSPAIQRGGRENVSVREYPLEGYALAVCTEEEEEISFREITPEQCGI